jgi:hypothetical protein
MIDDDDVGHGVWLEMYLEMFTWKLILMARIDLFDDFLIITVILNLNATAANFTQLFELTNIR